MYTMLCITYIMFIHNLIKNQLNISIHACVYIYGGFHAVVTKLGVACNREGIAHQT